MHVHCEELSRWLQCTRIVKLGDDPPPKLAELRAREPVSRVEFDGGPAWLLTRHTDVRAVLVDPRFAPYIPGIPIDVDEANNTAMLFLMHGAPHAGCVGC